MPQSPPNTPTPTTSRFRDLHARTYEIELLISGALVFGLIQVPSQIERALEYWLVRLDGLASPAATYLFLYGDMLAYALLGTFILHLCVRGYWVALLGLESVWPDGWDVTRLKFGPYSRPHIERDVSTLSASIDRADDMASVMFAAGALLAIIFLYSIVLVLCTVLVASGLPALSGSRISPGAAFFTALGVIMFLAIGLPMVDRLVGKHIPRHSRMGRAFDVVVRAATRLSPVRWTGPLQFVFQTYIGERRLGVALAVASVVLSSAMVGGLLWRTDIVRLDGWWYFDQAAAAGVVDPRHYRASGATRDGLLPSIDADIIEGPYLRLFLPYRPRRHNPLLAERCPAVAVAAKRTPDQAVAANVAAAACIGGLYQVSLDGRPLDAPTFDFTRDIPSDFVGVMTYVNVTGLAPGRHALTVVAPSRDPGAPTTHGITFYR